MCVEIHVGYIIGYIKKITLKKKKLFIFFLNILIFYTLL